jgi:hypothetical protein
MVGTVGRATGTDRLHAVPETCVTASNHRPAGSGDNRPGVGRRARQRRPDLRHRGGTLAATTGATIKELMARLGQLSPRAAMIYQHATSDRDKLIAHVLGKLADAARPEKIGRQVWG